MGKLKDSSIVAIVPILKVMDSKLTKTDRFINLILAIRQADNKCIDDATFREILGSPSKSQYHKYLVDLVETKDGRPSLIHRTKTEGSYLYQLREDLFGTKETQAKPKLTLLGDIEYGEIRVYGISRDKFEAINGIRFDIIQQDKDFCLYRCAFENSKNFLEMIFGLADDIEIDSPEALKKEFIVKAQKAAFLNMSSHLSGKKAA